MTDDCAICFESITATTGKSVMSCGHEFHLKCLVQWLQQPNGAGSCPCCRREPGALEQVVSSSADDDSTTITNSVTNQTPLMDAIQDGHSEDFLYFLREGNMIHLADSDGDTALHYAVFMNSAPMVLALLDAGANPNHLNNENGTDLMYACGCLHLGRIVSLLLDYGVNANLRDNDGWSALDTAAYNNNGVALTLLLEHGVAGLDTALHRACENSAILCVQVLLDRGVDVNVRIGRGKTPLMTAVSNDASPELVELLLERGARIYDVDEDGWNTFMWLTDSPSIDPMVMTVLLEAGPQWKRMPNGRWAQIGDTWGETDDCPPPMHLALLTERAATTIQAVWRGWLTRKRLSVAVYLLASQLAATKIQAVWRGWFTRIVMKRLKSNRCAVHKIQAAWRGWETRRMMRMARSLLRLR